MSLKAWILPKEAAQRITERLYYVEPEGLRRQDVVVEVLCPTMEVHALLLNTECRALVLSEMLVESFLVGHLGVRSRTTSRYRDSSWRASSYSFRALKRRLGEDASPEGLIPSFRTGVVAEPAL